MSTTHPDTRQRAEAFVSRCLHPYADEHDVPAITDELHGNNKVSSSGQNVATDDDAPDDDAGQEVSAPHEGDVLGCPESSDLKIWSGPHDGDVLNEVRSSAQNVASAPRDGDAKVPTGTFPMVMASAPHDGDTLWPGFHGTQARASAPHDGDTLPELTAESSVAEVRWVAAEARALRGSDDEQRRARFMARKAALLAYIERTGR